MKEIVFISVITLLSCSSKVKDTNIEIIINDNQSYKYDLKNNVYTIYYMNKAATEIKFNLSKEEKHTIINSYYTLKIDKITDINKITGNIYIDDKCTTMPKSFTKLHIKTNYSLQEIQIDEDCNDFYLSNYLKAKRIKRFLKVIRNILQSKPQIKNAPVSDIMYM